MSPPTKATLCTAAAVVWFASFPILQEWALIATLVALMAFGVYCIWQAFYTGFKR